MAAWRNWSGSVEARPAQIARPRTEAELGALVRDAAKVRVVGAGHSFMPLCETDGLLLQLDDLEGALTVSDDGKRAICPAGWSLKRLTAALWEKGVSLANQGDVNPQSLAGAISTGTHGTGAALGSLSTMARAFRIVQADGSLVSCSAAENPDLFQAARLSLGLLGVVTQIEIDVVAAYHLEERVQRRQLSDIDAQWEELASAHRHVEFFVFPYADAAILKTLQPAPPEGELTSTTDIDETPFKFACEVAAAMPILTSPLQKLMMRAPQDSRRVGPAYQVFPSERNIRFEEMEYELPRAAGFAALKEVIARIRRKKLPVAFPFEFRLTAGDDIWLSPFNKGPGASISMHQYAKMAWREIFAEAEQIFRAHGGRPHWAKRHTLTAADIRALYPMAEAFCAVRASVDPGAKFANAHLMDAFAIEASASLKGARL